MIPSVDPKLIFEVFRDEFGHLSARCLNAGIATKGADLNELHDNLTAAIAAYYPGEEPPAADAVHLIVDREEGLHVG